MKHGNDNTMPTGRLVVWLAFVTLMAVLVMGVVLNLTGAN
jgi:hypothetical protein